MKEAFRLGGDFHSRTALGMYDHIKAAIAGGERLDVEAAAAPARCCDLAHDHSKMLETPMAYQAYIAVFVTVVDALALGAGECILEWDGAEGEKPPVPLLKNMFANERRKAKVQFF